MTKELSILGSTGSIGTQALEVARYHNIRIASLAANTNVDLMERQVREFHPRLAVMYEASAAEELRRRLSDLAGVEVRSGLDGLIAAATPEEADTVLTAIVGIACLKPTLAAIERGKRIALANKETLVSAGELVMDAAERYNAQVVPVDSEHSAIFQCLQASRDRGEIRRLILTCSGGTFFGCKAKDIYNAGRAQALRNPNWSMGDKVTIDSATLMNKGLEVIEAMRLYRLPRKQVDVVIHRESIIHSMVEFCDNAVLAQMGTPDMCLPIQYALTYPHRSASQVEPLDLVRCGTLTFAAPDMETFPCLKIAMEAAEVGGTACAVLNGANEAAVALFLRDEIVFGQIAELVRDALERVPSVSHPALEEILQADAAGREAVREAFRQRR